ncbi:hypothetical protein BOTBODRAFT_146913 [Botryobasidium botryosum FD-172 SS1]|uniref:Uncharacterized protein n=1 Tax=Botryobasidium botryosum (strain FD-172 SS1) TaxID=930990 RepID=A0A067MJC9_BOTB1|nr:hypothetical protein BOTBODRAFT_146913 [Botryobasidium botryosum FD-172 SS1]
MSHRGRPSGRGVEGRKGGGWRLGETAGEAVVKYLCIGVAANGASAGIHTHRVPEALAPKQHPIPASLRHQKRSGSMAIVAMQCACVRLQTNSGMHFSRTPGAVCGRIPALAPSESKREKMSVKIWVLSVLASASLMHQQIGSLQSFLPSLKNTDRSVQILMRLVANRAHPSNSHLRSFRVHTTDTSQASRCSTQFAQSKHISAVELVVAPIERYIEFWTGSGSEGTAASRTFGWSERKIQDNAKRVQRSSTAFPGIRLAGHPSPSHFALHNSPPAASTAKPKRPPVGGEYLTTQFIFELSESAPELGAQRFDVPASRIVPAFHTDQPSRGGHP